MNENSSQNNESSVSASLNYNRPSVTTIDILKQELYQTQLQLKTKNAFISELQNDVEQLQIVEDDNIKLKSEILTKESDLRQWTVKYSNLEFKLLDQQKDHLSQIDLLNEQLSVLKNLKDKPKEDSPVNLNESIITELKTELNEKKEKYEEMQNIINNQEIIIMELEHSKSKAIEELEEFKVKVDFKTDQLNEWKQKYETLQEECEMLRLQLNSINNLNDHNKRGNSLFAEVDDKRQALTTELEMKREKYETLKKCLSKANHDNNQMKMEIMRLEKQLLETERNDDLEKSTLIQSYKNRISDLEAKIRELDKRPETPQVLKIDNLSNDGMNVVLQIVSDVRKEKKALEEEMNRRSIRDMEARQQCFKGECEIRQLKKEMRRDKLQLKELEQQISVLKSKLSSSKENIGEDKRMTSKGVRFHNNCKIEDGGPSLKLAKKIPQQAVLNTIVCPKLEEL
ncbi:protein Spindly [Rhopalosiphum maidis]|uniref:protein Spindly n=1 Tax=Rhopalosiphum maidis TaxID=43146 RepID=UPI000EFF4718|nr:protein Spindly [Rhopalosiphum maidis]XP_026805788.1 protein Spindly [Rhopalosiphum maidis]